MDIEAVGNSLAGQLGFANSIDAIDFLSKFDGTINGSNGPAAFLHGCGESEYGHLGSGNSMTGNLNFATSIYATDFLV